MPRSASVTQVRAVHRSNRAPTHVRDGVQTRPSADLCSMTALTLESGRSRITWCLQLFGRVCITPGSQFFHVLEHRPVWLDEAIRQARIVHDLKSHNGPIERIAAYSGLDGTVEASGDAAPANFVGDVVQQVDHCLLIAHKILALTFSLARVTSNTCSERHALPPHCARWSARRTLVAATFVR